MAESGVPAAVIAQAVAAARVWLRGGADDEAAVAGTVRAAVAVAEAFCGEALAARAWEDVLVATGTWQRLAARPVTAIAGVVALAPDAAPVVVPVGGYAVDIDADGTGWVRITGERVAGDRVAVSYSAGRAAAWAEVPAPIAQGVMLLVAHLLDNRAADAVPPAAVAALWRPFRRLALAGERR